MKLLVLLAIFTFSRADYIAPHSNDLDPNSRVIGGSSISINSAPWQVSVQYLSKHQCGGSIIARDWVLTAATCVRAYSAYYTIRSGSSYHDIGGSIHSVKQIIRHEGSRANEYGFYSDNIALIRVNASFLLDSTRSIATLFNIDDVISTSSSVYVHGWGDLIITSQNLQRYLSYAINKLSCNSTYSRYGGIQDHQSCIGPLSGISAACPTDVGGPVTPSSIYGNRLGGIISWAEGCGRSNFPTIVTDVGSYRFWIRRHTGV